MPSTELRQSVLSGAKRVVVKIGTQLLTLPKAEGGGINKAFINGLAKQIAGLREKGVEVTLVSSGAVGAGCVELEMTERPSDVAGLQAAAAIGQRRLMDLMHKAFEKHGISVAQILLTRTDFDDRTRYLNIRNCIRKLHEYGTLPILNENDTVSVDELRFGDNDMLAALTCNALRAQAVVLLTSVDGLLDEQMQVIDLVDDVDKFMNLTNDDEKTSWGSGGMGSKLEAARLVTDAGDVAVIASGREKSILLRLMDGEKLGTVLLPAKRKLASKQRWIALTKRPAGTLVVDEGAANALIVRKKSLLASGIVKVSGRFEKGDILAIKTEGGDEIARGLTNFDHEDLKLIAGKRSDQFEKILGRVTYAEVIHRDYLVMRNGAG
ncbi:Glutamate 5-kinase [Poriferisphaera corsica]|uniref:Glutamate 5-kinase n=1 Tax=Poriferisphaera corsica TaxID=2528020 RepID=A0A517YWR1_9BACT|nr:glutamate 5-kinase [Poriferisphaera corsica]QDU34650.1 Glutamate 5-kinase [Poriferisphaera corsica]